MVAFADGEPRRWWKRRNGKPTANLVQIFRIRLKLNIIIRYFFSILIRDTKSTGNTNYRLHFHSTIPNHSSRVDRLHCISSGWKYARVLHKSCELRPSEYRALCLHSMNGMWYNSTVPWWCMRNTNSVRIMKRVLQLIINSLVLNANFEKEKKIHNIFHC